MKYIFLKLEYNISLIICIHYLHLEAFEFCNISTIACRKVLTCNTFVCSLRDHTSWTDLWSSADVSSLPHLWALSFSCIICLFLALFDNFCQGSFFIWSLNMVFIKIRVHWGCMCDLACRPTLFYSLVFPSHLFELVTSVLHESL